MSERKLKRVPKWVSNAERREFARKLAARKYGGQDVSSALLWLGYAGGIEDAMLTPEDIGTIFRISAEILASKPAEVQMGIGGDPEHYAEVLKRFNEIKFKK